MRQFMLVLISTFISTLAFYGAYQHLGDQLEWSILIGCLLGSGITSAFIFGSANSRARYRYQPMKHLRKGVIHQFPSTVYTSAEAIDGGKFTVPGGTRVQLTGAVQDWGNNTYYHATVLKLGAEYPGSRDFPAKVGETIAMPLCALNTNMQR